MKRLIFLSVLVFSCMLAYSQANWKDSLIDKKYKPLEVYEAHGLVYFKTKKGWGAYWPTQSWVAVKPEYQFVLCANPETMTEFYVIKKKALQVINGEGKPITTKTYSRIGTGVYGQASCKIENDQMWLRYPDSSIVKEHYGHLHAEISLAIKGNLVFINNTRVPVDPDPKGGVYDFVSGQWIVPEGVCATRFCGTNILVIDKAEIKNGDRVIDFDQVTILDKTFQKTGSFSFEDATSKPDIIKLILSDHTPVLVEPCFKKSGTRKQLFKFDNGLKQGIYDPYAFTVIMNADKYDFLFVPNAFEQTVFTVENGKVGILNQAEKNKDYSNLYTKLSKTNFFISSTEQFHNIVECNGNGGEPVSQIDTGQINANFLSQMVGFRRNASLEVNGNFIIQHDYIPKINYYNEPIVVYDSEGVAHDSIRYEESGESYTVYRMPEPAESYSGVYNTVSKTWVVPRKFSKMRQTESGFACVLQRNDTILFSFFSNEGKKIFTDLQADSLLNNKDLFNKFCGFRFSAAVQIQKRSGIEGFFEGLPIVVNEQKKSGVFDLINLKWIIDPENDLVDKGNLLFNYFVLQNNKLGMVDGFGNEIAKPMFNKIEYLFHEGGYILDDSLFCDATHPFKVALTDTSKFLSKDARNRDPDPQTIFQKAEIINKKLYVEENTRTIRYGYNELDFMEYALEKAVSYARVTEPQNFKQTYFKGAEKLIPWKNGHLILDTAGVWSFINDKEERTIFKGITKISLNKDYIFSSFINTQYSMNGDGTIVYEGGNNEFLFNNSAHSHNIVGRNSMYFDGTSILENPKDFFLMALNKAKLGLGYTVVKNKSGFERKYTYYDFNTKQFLPVDLPFVPIGNLKVADINGYFACMEDDHKKGIANVWLLEQDLKTVKSSFLELKYYSFETVSNPLDLIILFQIGTKAKKEMYFDKDFQFMFEADQDQFKKGYPVWDRLVLKSPKKSIQLNLKGQILNN